MLPAGQREEKNDPSIGVDRPRSAGHIEASVQLLERDTGDVAAGFAAGRCPPQRVDGTRVTRARNQLRAQADQSGRTAGPAEQDRPRTARPWRGDPAADAPRRIHGYLW